MDSVGSVVLIAVTVAVGLAFVAGIVQLWRHQPVHHDAGDALADEDLASDEETVALERDDEDHEQDESDEQDESEGEPEDEVTIDLRGPRP